MGCGIDHWDGKLLNLTNGVSFGDVMLSNTENEGILFLASRVSPSWSEARWQDYRGPDAGSVPDEAGDRVLRR